MLGRKRPEIAQPQPEPAPEPAEQLAATEPALNVLLRA